MTTCLVISVVPTEKSTVGAAAVDSCLAESNLSHKPCMIRNILMN